MGNYLVSDTDTLPVWEREDIRDELYEIGYNIGKLKIFIFIDSIFQGDDFMILVKGSSSRYAK